MTYKNPPKADFCFLFHCLEKLLEHFRFMLGEICEDLAIDHDFLFLKCGDEFAVGHTFCSCGGVDLHAPQPSRGPLFLFAPAECMAPCVKQGFLGGAFLRLPAPPEPFRIL